MRKAIVVLMISGMLFSLLSCNTNDNRTEYVNGLYITYTDDPVPTGYDSFDFGSYDNQIDLDSVLQGLEDRGYTVTPETENSLIESTIRFAVKPIDESQEVSGNNMEYVLFDVYPSLERAKELYQSKLMTQRAWVGGNIRINNMIVFGSTNAMQDLYELYAIEQPPKYKTVDEFTVLASKYTLRADFEERLTKNDYNVFLNDPISYNIYGPDYRVMFELYKLSEVGFKDKYAVLDFIDQPDRYGLVWAECFLDGESYFLSAPLDEIYNILEIICEE